MSSDARSKVIKEINKKAKHIKELRTNSSKEMSPEDIVYDFIKQVERFIATAEDSIEFQELLDESARQMDTRMKAFDSQVVMEMIWNGDANNYTELRLNGVNITWSEDYLSKNPEQSKTISIDVGQMLIDEIKSE